MPKTIVQKIVFKNTTAKALYDLYMDAKKHSLVTGAPAKISSKEGSKYSAHGGYITGKNLQLVKDKLIVQSWRAEDWNQEDIDSTFIIFLETKGKDVIVHATHANVPDGQIGSLKSGWNDYYWKPWKKYLLNK